MTDIPYNIGLNPETGLNIDSHQAENLGERRKMHMKKFATMLCAAVMTASLSIAAIAAPSIGELIPEAPAVAADQEEYIPEGAKLVVTNVETQNYMNEKVTKAVDEFNAEDSTVTIQDTMKELDVDVTAENKTTDDTVVDLAEYKALMPAFADLALEENGELSYKLAKEGKIEASFKLELAKELNKDDLLIMQVDPETEEVYFVELKDFDPATGEITAEFPCLGPIVVLTKGEAAK